jgi:Major Facilitator Superfamily
MTDAVLVVVQGAIVGKCFGRGNISTAFGATLFFSRFGSFAGFAAPGFLAERFGLVWSMWISALVCFLSVSASVTYLILEQRHDSASGMAHAFSGHASSPSLRDTPSRILAIIFIPKRDFWVLVYVWSAISSAVFTVLHFGADIASTSLRIGHSSSRAGLTSGLVLLFAGFSSPMFGWFQDHVGHRIYLLSVALALCCTGILFGIVGLMVNVWLFAPGIALLALGFSIAPVTLLSCVSLVVEHDSLPAALGLYKATENLAMSLTHWIAGLIRDVSSSYSPTLAFLAIIAASGSVGALLLKRGQACRILDESASHDDMDEVTMFEVLDTGL